ncbi:MAG: hypothetical protein AAGM22_16490 [Acidobacteriota bacterium]
MALRPLSLRFLILGFAAVLLFGPGTALAQIGPTTSPSYAIVPSPANPVAGGARGETTMIIEGFEGIDSAPISADLRQALLADWQATGESATATYFINPLAIEAIERSLQTGVLDPYLEPYARQDRSSCSDLIRTKSKNVPLNWNGDSISGPVGPFTGQLGLDVDLNGSATGVFQYRIKRFGLFGACIPYWVKFDHLRVYGNASLDGDIELSGSLSNNDDPWEWSTQIAKPHLGSLNFFIGPIYVHLGFNLPIRAGVQVGLTVEATVTYETAGDSTGSFDYTCHSFNNCVGTSSFHVDNLTTPQAITGSIEGRADIQGYVDVGVRAYLYSDSFLYAQVGVRPKAYVDLWGYYGNNCGDVDCDSDPETVSALTASIDWQLFINAKAFALGATWEWDDLWSTPRHHLAFIDFLGTPALDPMLHGPDSTQPGAPTTYQARMRPCWPYDDDVTYEVVWEDGTVNTFTKDPHQYQDLNHIFFNAGTAPVTLTALHDAHGRQLNRSTTRDIEVSVLSSTDDPDCSAGGTTDTGDDGPDGPTTLFACLAVATGGNPGWDMQCSGSGHNGVAPYVYYWRYGTGTWFSGPSSMTFECEALDDPISFRVRDANGDWSEIYTDACPGGIA